MIRWLWALATLATLQMPMVASATSPPSERAGALSATRAVSPYLSRLRSVREVFAYRLHTGGLMYCDSLEGSGPGLGCPAVFRRWQVENSGWMDSLTSLLLLPEAYNGGDKLSISYPDFALRAEGPEGWTEVIFTLSDFGFWIRSPGLPGVHGYYDHLHERMHALIREILPPDMTLDANGLLDGPHGTLPTDDPNRDAPVAYDVAPMPITTPLPACPDSLRQACGGDSVRLRIRISQDGRIRSVRPITGDSSLVRFASSAVQKWIYRPALRGNRPVPVWIEVRVKFANP